MHKRCHLFIVTALLLFFFGMATLWLNRPFIGHHDFINVQHINRARNYWDFGFFAHHGLQITNLPHQADAPAIIYRNTPPGLSITLSFAIKAFSTTEATTRIYGIFITLISISIFYRLGLAILSRRGALLATLFFASAPQVIYFSTINTPEIPVTPFALGLMWAYATWIKHPRRRYEWVMGICGFLGIWFFYFMPWLLAAIFLHSLFTGTRRQQWMTLRVGLVGAVSLALWILAISDGFDRQVIQETLDYIQYRSSTTGVEREVPVNFTVFQFVGRYVFYLVYGLSLFGLFFSIFGAYVAPNGIIVTMFGAAFLHTLFWRNATYIHDLFIYPLIWSLVLWAGHGLDVIWKNRRGIIPTRRLHRVADGILFGHLVLAIAVVIFLAQFENSPIMWLSENIRENTPDGGVAATNLANLGPHIEYYAEREVIYGVDYSELERLFQEERHDLYMYCDPDVELGELPAGLRAEPVKTCYMVMPVTSPSAE